MSLSIQPTHFNDYDVVSMVGDPEHLLCWTAQQSYQKSTETYADEAATIKVWKAASKEPEPQLQAANSRISR